METLVFDTQQEAAKEPLEEKKKRRLKRKGNDRFIENLTTVF